MLFGFGHAESILRLRGGAFSGLLALASLVVVLGVYEPHNVYATVIGENEDPNAIDDVAFTDEDNAVTIDVLANDTDPNGDTLLVVSVTTPINGGAVLNPDNTITYTPNTDFFGVDFFIYTIDDGSSALSTATVSVTILSVNDPPSDEDESFVVNEDETIFFNVLDNASDPDGDVLDASLLSGPSHGILSLDSNGDATYTPDPNFNGLDSFTYDVSDGNGGTATSITTIEVLPVNDAPVAVDDSYEINTGETLTANIFDNDSDVDGDFFLAIITQAPSNGILILTASTGEFTYTPNDGFFGVDSFKYELDDGLLSNTEATVTINVLSPSDQTQNLIADVENASLSKTVEKALMGPLKKIVKILEDDNPDNDGSVCGKLDEFIDTVDAKEAAGQLDPADADAFRTAAEDIQLALGC